MKRRAVILAPGYLATPNGKTAHGLLRGGDRYDVVAVIDASSAGRDAGEVAIGRALGVPVVADLAEAMDAPGGPLEVAVVGVATHGGSLEPAVRALALEAAGAGLDVVSGLHDLLGDDPDIAAAAAKSGATLIDLRRPRPRAELHFWTGAARQPRSRRVAVLGTDCAIGKRTTTWLLLEALRQRQIAVEMIYTGQTGWMQGARYGFVLDATLNDYVAGELEHAVLSCEREAAPELVLIEGQSSLRNPSGPCGPELLLSAGAREVVLQHQPGRRYFEGYEAMELPLPPLSDEIALIRAYGAEVVALAINPALLGAEAARAEAARLAAELEIAAFVVPEDIEALARSLRP